MQVAMEKFRSTHNNSYLATKDYFKHLCIYVDIVLSINLDQYDFRLIFTYYNFSLVQWLVLGALDM